MIEQVIAGIIGIVIGLVIVNAIDRWEQKRKK
jgi:hypothetical protein